MMNAALQPMPEPVHGHRQAILFPPEFARRIGRVCRDFPGGLTGLSKASGVTRTTLTAWCSAEEPPREVLESKLRAVATATRRAVAWFLEASVPTTVSRARRADRSQVRRDADSTRADESMLARAMVVLLLQRALRDISGAESSRIRARYLHHLDLLMDDVDMGRFADCVERLWRAGAEGPPD